MASIFEDKDRKIIPRWREFARSVHTGELDPLRPVNRKPSPSELDRCRSDWEGERSLGVAADFVSSAIALGLASEATDAAEFLLANESEAPAGVLELAKRIVLPPTDDVPPLFGQALLHLRVAQLKKALRDDPRNAIAWIDLARTYEVLGQRLKAEESSKRALILAPFNRFVLRSSARMLIHHDRYGEAQQLLRRNPRTPSDPWLMAAEIAASAIINKPSSLIKTAKVLIDKGGLRPLHLSELSSALGSLEFEAGNGKRGRKLIIASLEEPTENAVAQAAWTARTFGIKDVLTQTATATTKSWEADMWLSFREGHWGRAFVNSTEWFREEPFSSRPPVMGSYISLVALGRPDLSEQVCRRGLQANPNEFTLRNNLVVALAELNRIADAEAEFSLLDRSALSGADEVVYNATQGLILFRRGAVERGRQFYRTAIELADQLTDEKRRLAARLYLAREELMAGTPNSREIVHASAENPVWDQYAELKVMVNRLREVAANPQQLRPSTHVESDGNCHEIRDLAP